MDPAVIIGISVAILFLLLFLGVPVGICLLLSGFVGIAMLRPFDIALNSLFIWPWSFASSYTFSVVCLFIFAGQLAYSAGVAADAFRVGDKLLRRFPGGVPLATLFGCAAFAATTGSSTATVGAIAPAALSELNRYGYDKKLSAGTIASSGTLGILIPPSIPLVIYGIASETSIGQLFVGAVIPGLLSVLIYAVMISTRFSLDSNLGPSRLQGVPWKEALLSLPKLWGVALLFVVMIGGIYSGVFTPTEAGAAGSACALAILLIKSNNKWHSLWQAIKQTVGICGMLFLMLLGASLFAGFITVSALPIRIGEWVSSLTLPAPLIVGLFLLMYLVLGGFLVSTPTILITTPVVVPALVGLGYDPVWLGIIVIKMCELGSITPPVGVTAYTTKSVAPDIPLMDIFKGSMWFLLMDAITIAILVIFPSLVLWLPSMMISR